MHVLLLAYAVDEDALRLLLSEHDPVTEGPDESGLRLIDTLGAGRQPDSREHFGFVDGVGQPVVAGSGRYERQMRRTGHATSIAAGEFVLGYTNEDEVLPPTPMADQTSLPGSSTLPAASVAPQTCAGESRS